MQVSHIVKCRQVEGVSWFLCCLGGSFGEEGLTVQRGSSKVANNGTLSLYLPFSLFLHNHRAESAFIQEVLKEAAIGYG